MTPAHVITGSFGAGKITAIRRLMSHKPEPELWEWRVAGMVISGVVILIVGRR